MTAAPAHIIVQKNNRLANAASIIALLGLAAFITLFWGQMNTGMRMFTTLGLGMMLHTMAMMVWQATAEQGLSPFPAKVILFAAFLLQTTGAFILLNAIASSFARSEGGAILVLLLMAAQEILLYRHYRHATILYYPFVAVSAAAFAGLLALGASPDGVALALGASLLLLSRLLQETRLGAASPAGFVLGCCLFFIALFRLTHGSLAELLYPAMLLVTYSAAIRLRSCALLWSSAVFTMAYCAYATTAYIMQSPLWSLSLVLLCLMVFACLSLTAALRRRYFLP